jgi:hypothetical protein
MIMNVENRLLTFDSVVHTDVMLTLRTYRSSAKEKYEQKLRWLQTILVLVISPTYLETFLSCTS